MGAQVDSVNAVATVLTAASVPAIIKCLSNAAPPVTEYCTLTVETSSLDRGDTDAYDGQVAVTIDWNYPGAATDGETEFLAALDRFDALSVALTTNLDRTCVGVDPSAGVERKEESADLKGYEGTIVCTFMRKEAGSP